MSKKKKSNLLKDKHPEIAEEWLSERNAEQGIKKNQASCGSEKRVWWKCKNCGHEWEASIHSRVQGRGCPACNTDFE